MWTSEKKLFNLHPPQLKFCNPSTRFGMRIKAIRNAFVLRTKNAAHTHIHTLDAIKWVFCMHRISFGNVNISQRSVVASCRSLANLKPAYFWFRSLQINSIVCVCVCAERTVVHWAMIFVMCHKHLFCQQNAENVCSLRKENLRKWMKPNGKNVRIHQKWCKLFKWFPFKRRSVFIK